MNREKIIKDLISHLDEEEKLEVKINGERNPNRAYNMTSRLYWVRAQIRKLTAIVRKIPHNRGEHEFDSTNPNYDKIDYGILDRK